MPLDNYIQKDKTAKRAMIKARRLSALITKLQNTDIGTIHNDITNINNNINNLYAADQVIHNQIAAISSVLGISFNPDGTLLSEAYTTHTHPITQ